jgi:hypothetical protein
VKSQAVHPEPSSDELTGYQNHCTIHQDANGFPPSGDLIWNAGTNIDCAAVREGENNTDQNESVDRPKNLGPNPHGVAETGQVWLVEGHCPASQKGDRYRKHDPRCDSDLNDAIL